MLRFVIGYNISRHFIHQSEETSKPDRDLVTCVFPHLAPATCICLELWLVHWIICLCFDWSEYLLWFWFYDTQVKTVLSAIGKLLLFLYLFLHVNRCCLFRTSLKSKHLIWVTVSDNTIFTRINLPLPFNPSPPPPSQAYRIELMRSRRMVI